VRALAALLIVVAGLVAAFAIYTFGGYRQGNSCGLGGPLPDDPSRAEWSCADEDDRPDAEGCAPTGRAAGVTFWICDREARD